MRKSEVESTKKSPKPDYKRARRLLAKLLFEDRKEKGLNQVDYCEQVLNKHGISVTYGFLQQWEKEDSRKGADNKSLPDIVNFAGVAKCFGYTLTEFFDYLTGTETFVTPEYDKVYRQVSSLPWDDRVRMVRELQDALLLSANPEKNTQGAKTP
ncbi:hypothetical protein [Crocosphaera sp.]|uniref:hypothetical protein n=1 Tax=Crocosphaera sp. TaxID=2729996 RepID=UPI00260CBAC2|nr:hypothetical protein [Crocosphaera sp.]MDJ0579111.1 hypothetical protein [Crocosphaera sp.]